MNTFWLFRRALREAQWQARFERRAPAPIWPWVLVLVLLWLWSH